MQDVSVVSLKALLKELDDTLLLAENALNQMKEAVPKLDITEQLVKSQETEQETLFAAALSGFDNHIAVIKKASNTNDVLNKIQQETQIFNQKKSSNAQLLQRQQVLQNFEIAYQNYLQLKAYLGEGTQFYVTLQESLQKFKSKCYDFTFARKTEKQDLVVAIQTKHVPQQTLQPNGFGGSMTASGALPQGTFHVLPMGRGVGGTQHQPQPIMYATQGPPMMAGRGGPILVQQPQMMQPQQVRVASGQAFQPVVFMQQPLQQQHQLQQQQLQQQQLQQQQFQHQQLQQQQPVFNQQQAQPPPYTQSQAQRSVFPENPYGNLGPNTGF